jgi:thiamine-phosphate pyrophosphorylase
VKSLYVTDRRAIGEERFGAVLSALRGAPEVTVQLREREISDREYLARARSCREAVGPGTPLLVNRRFDIALAAGADGVHLPDGGLPPARVAGRLRRGFRVGVSTHSANDAAGAIAAGADLVVLGPIFDTPSKRGLGEPLGTAELSKLPLRREHSADVYAIGGITEENLEEIEAFRERVSGIAAIRLFQESPDPRALAERLARR